MPTFHDINSNQFTDLTSPTGEEKIQISDTNRVALKNIAKLFTQEQIGAAVELAEAEDLGGGSSGTPLFDNLSTKNINDICEVLLYLVGVRKGWASGEESGLAWRMLVGDVIWHLRLGESTFPGVGIIYRTTDQPNKTYWLVIVDETLYSLSLNEDIFPNMDGGPVGTRDLLDFDQLEPTVNFAYSFKDEPVKVTSEYTEQSSNRIEAVDVTIAPGSVTELSSALQTVKYTVKFAQQSSTGIDWKDMSYQPATLITPGYCTVTFDAQSNTTDIYRVFYDQDSPSEELIQHRAYTVSGAIGEDRRIYTVRAIKHGTADTRVNLYISWKYYADDLYTYPPLE